jgi:hypothetical protein
MLLRCPHCASPEVEAIGDQTEVLACDNCEARFVPAEALVSFAAAEARAQEHSACNGTRGCPQCFQRAEEIVGATIHDQDGHEWEVTYTGEKDGSPTVGGDQYWAYAHDVTVLSRQSERTYTLVAFALYPNGKTGDVLARTHAPSITGVFSDLGKLLERAQIDPEADVLEVTLSWEEG